MIRKKIDSRLLKKIQAELGVVIVKAYPEETSWDFPCPCCGKWLHSRLVFDIDSVEWQLEITEAFEP